MFYYKNTFSFCQSFQIGKISKFPGREAKLSKQELGSKLFSMQSRIPYKTFKKEEKALEDRKDNFRL